MRKSHLFAGISAFAAFAACGGDDGGDNTSTSVATLCARGCARANAANCSGDNKTSCESECTASFAMVPMACSSQLNAELQCASKASFTCDVASKQSSPSGCDSQLSALTSCIAANTVIDAGVGPTRPDASLPSAGSDAGHDAGTQVHNDAGQAGGGDGGTVPMCVTKPSDDHCTACGNINCCDETITCASDPDCLKLSTCLDACPAADDGTCSDACAANTTQAAVEKFTGIADCYISACPSECGGATNVPTGCLDSTVPTGTCTDVKRPVGYDCPSAVPPGDCVLLPNLANVYCCAS